MLFEILNLISTLVLLVFAMVFFYKMGKIEGRIEARIERAKKIQEELNNAHS